MESGIGNAVGCGSICRIRPFAYTFTIVTIYGGRARGSFLVLLFKSNGNENLFQFLHRMTILFHCSEHKRTRPVDGFVFAYLFSEPQ